MRHYDGDDEDQLELQPVITIKLENLCFFPLKSLQFVFSFRHVIERNYDCPGDTPNLPVAVFARKQTSLKSLFNVTWTLLLTNTKID
jgi:hypothetical protein